MERYGDYEQVNGGVVNDLLDQLDSLQRDYDLSCDLNKAFAEDRVVVIKPDSSVLKNANYETTILNVNKIVALLSKSVVSQQEQLITDKLVPLIDAELLRIVIAQNRDREIVASTFESYSRTPSTGIGLASMMHSEMQEVERCKDYISLRNK